LLHKPAIVSVAGVSAASASAKAVDVKYGQEFDIAWDVSSPGGNVNVTSVTIVAPSTSTHSFNNNQRVVILPIIRSDARTRLVRVRAPPNANVAPPQQYMLFLNNVKTHSTSVWVRLDEGPAPAAATGSPGRPAATANASSTVSTQGGI
jgi:hypothetical protein